MNTKDQERFVRAFVLPDKQDRWLILLASTKGRKKLVETFCHSYEFSDRWATKLDEDASIDDILGILKDAGAGRDCEMLSSNRKLDGKSIGLELALEKTMRTRTHGSYLVCDPGRLAYFESEEWNQRYLLRRENPAAAKL